MAVTGLGLSLDFDGEYVSLGWEKAGVLYVNGEEYATAEEGTGRSPDAVLKTFVINYGTLADKTDGVTKNRYTKNDYTYLNKTDTHTDVNDTDYPRAYELDSATAYGVDYPRAGDTKSTTASETDGPKTDDSHSIAAYEAEDPDVNASDSSEAYGADHTGTRDLPFDHPSDILSLEIDSGDVASINKDALNLTPSYPGTVDPAAANITDGEEAGSQMDLSWTYLDETMGYEDLYLYQELQDGNLGITLAVPDLTGDGAADLLRQELTNGNGLYSTEISVISGSNGTTVWSLPLEGAIAYAFPAGDLNDDGLEDVVTDVVLGGQIIPYSGILALNGPDGEEIWSRYAYLGATVAYPLYDHGEDIGTNLLVHEFLLGENGTVTTQICTLTGTNGSEIDLRSYPEALALEYPAGNLTGDGMPDLLVTTFDIEESYSEDDSYSEDTYATEGSFTLITAVDRATGLDLWSRSFYGLGLGVPTADLSGDGLDDLLVYGLDQTYYGLYGTISAVVGVNGTLLWERGYDTLAIASPALDFTGDGVVDLLIYEVGEDSKVTAVNGLSGEDLWMQRSPVFSWPGLK